MQSAVVKVKSGNMPSSEWRRPLQRLYPLEVKLNTEPDNAVPITFVRDGDIPAVVVNPARVFLFKFVCHEIFLILNFD